MFLLIIALVAVAAYDQPFRPYNLLVQAQERDLTQGFAYLEEQGVLVHVPSTLHFKYDSSVYSDAVVSSEYKCNQDLQEGLIRLRGCIPQSRSPVQTMTFEFVLTKDGHSFTKQQNLTIINYPKRFWPLENEEGVWPPQLPNAVANIMEDYQTFACPAYWHQGLDIRSDMPKRKFVMQDEEVGRPTAGPCHCPVDGMVINIVQYGRGHLYWSFMVRDKFDFIWQFHHIDPQTYKHSVGDVIKSGEVIGNVAAWPASQNGQLYHHVHMNVARYYGNLKVPIPYTDGWVYYNPYDFLNHGSYKNLLKPYADQNVYFTKHNEDVAFAVAVNGSEQAVKLSGSIDILASFSSEFSRSNNVSGYPYVLGVNKLWYSLESDQVQGSFDHIDMFRMQWYDCQPDYTLKCTSDHLLRVYKKQFRYKWQTIRSVFDYRSRKVWYRVGAYENGLNTLKYANGVYDLTITASDWFGKQTSLKVKVEVHN